MSKTNYSNVIESANKSIENIAKDLRESTKAYKTLSQVWKDMTRANILKAGFGKVLEELGVNASDSPCRLLESLHPDMWRVTEATKKNPARKYVGIFVLVKVKDENGNVVMDAKGEPVREAKHREIKAWTPKALCQLIAQSNALMK